MIVGSNQPYFFPYIGYWQLMSLSDVYVISDNMQYIKKGYVNRNYILLNGERHRVTLEVLGVHGKTLINKTYVGNNVRKIIKTLSFAYKKAPQYDLVFPIIESILRNEEKNLAKYLGNSIEVIAKYLEINTEFIYLSKLQGETHLKAQDRTLDICKKTNATQYINAIGGQDIYNKEDFRKEGITLSFLQSKNIEYNQYYNQFVSHLSILDVLMFNSIEEIKNMLTHHDLV